MLILLQAGDLDGIILAKTTLKQMLSHEDPAMRTGAARAIGELKAGKLKNELQQLIEDLDEQVARTAIKAVGQRKLVELAPALTTRLGSGQMGRTAGLVLTQLGVGALPALGHAARQGQFAARRAAIRFLAQKDSQQTEKCLIDLGRSGDFEIVTAAAREAAHRARRLGISDFIRAEANA